MNHINEGSYAIVLRTGFATEKGSALRKNLAVQYKELFIHEDLNQFYTIAATLAGSIALFYLIQQQFYSEGVKSNHIILQRVT